MTQGVVGQYYGNWNMQIGSVRVIRSVSILSEQACDSNDNNEFVCSDTDSDTCDDCSSGTLNTSDDGFDYDEDGACDAGDSDDDNDGALDENDSDDNNANVCSDTDSDTCDDCSSGSYDIFTDGWDYDGDGICDAGDDDADNDGSLGCNLPLDYAAYFPFNGDVNDYSSYNQHGTPEGITYTQDRFGNANSAILIDSKSDVVDIETYNSAQISTTSDLESIRIALFAFPNRSCV
jgi:hypothetical protein